MAFAYRITAALFIALVIGFEMRLFRLRRGFDIRLDDNAFLAMIGLTTICYFGVVIVAKAIQSKEEVTKQPHPVEWRDTLSAKEQADQNLKDAVVLGKRLAESDTLFKEVMKEYEEEKSGRYP